MQVCECVPAFVGYFYLVFLSVQTFLYYLGWWFGFTLPHGSSYLPFSFSSIFLFFHSYLSLHSLWFLPILVVPFPLLSFSFHTFFTLITCPSVSPSPSAVISVSFLSVSLFLSDVWDKERIGHAPYEGHARCSLHHLSVCSSWRP